MIIKYFKDYINGINEGLIKTYGGEIVANDISNLLIDLGLNFNVQFLKNESKIKLTFNFFNAIPSSNLEELFDIIDSSIINRGGWFPSKMDIVNIHGMKNSTKWNLENLFTNQKVYNIVEIFYEAKFDELVHNIPDKLYHLTIEEYKSKILKWGLIPKSGDKLTSHLDRIYLCRSIEDCENLIQKMKLYYNDEKSFNVWNKRKRKYDKKTIPVILEIDNSDKFIKALYKDPNYNEGFWTLDNIPPNKISQIK
jgi:hypothetical protein